jgi:hypothetical protein
VAHRASSLSAALAPHIPNYVRARSERYTRNDRTRNTVWGDSAISYRVQGSEVYDVDVFREPGALVFGCTCPYFEDRGPCKHLWAVAALIDRDPRWDGSWLEGDPAIEFVIGDLDAEDDGGPLEADVVDAGEPELWPGAPRGYWAPGFPQAPGRPRKPEHQADPVTAAAQAAVNRLAQLRQQLTASAIATEGGTKPPGPLPPPGAQLIFVVDAAETRAAGLLAVHVATRARAPEGREPKGPAEVVETPEGAVTLDRGWSAPRALKISPADVVRVTDPSDRALVALLMSASQGGYYGGYTAYGGYAGAGGPDVAALVQGNATGVGPGGYPGQEPSLFGQRYLPLDVSAAFWWVANLRMQGPVRIPRANADGLLADLLSQPVLPPLDVPEELRFDEPDITPTPVLTLRPDPNRHQTFSGTLAFDYDGALVERRSAPDAIYRPSPRSLIRRKRDAEAAAEEDLRAHRVRFTDTRLGRPYMAVPFKAAPAIVSGLVPKGWRITVDDKPFRVPGETAIDVTSRIDWFDLNGVVDFGGVAVPLPELLAAVRRGDTTVVLPDGSIGVLTRAWAEQYGGLSAFSGVGKDGLRVGASQLGLLDALLASREGVRWADRAREVRDRLRAFEGIAAVDAPVSFQGALRGYQRLGLGWLGFLQDLRMGGCLADDMGLGKTVTVLAMLDARRGRKGDAPRPSLVVAPRSLLFNWAREAARFTPALRVAEYHGAGRDDVLARLGELDGSSSKLDALLERLDEARAEGHKALVFSQFTSLLAFVRSALDEREVPYEYLDGQTRDRERAVARFQQDPSCPLFLVSLKAGGLGLNLTAADYVFLLDPWWNPAVEAQAIDRAHRIGQQRPVFAYRLIAADTVEERIVELQARKRRLADAIITADDSGLASLTREDLELLLR